MVKIETFVFFDAETTGLGFDEHSPTRFTELAFVACMREHLLDTNKAKMPRVVSKLLLPINPTKIISPTVTELTGLDNYMLEHYKKLDAKSIEMIDLFLGRLPSPVCLVAHNGKRFDFRLLKRHMNALNVQFHDEILCADSLEIFRRITDDHILDAEFSKELSIADFAEDAATIQKRNETTPKKLPVKRLAVALDHPYPKPPAARCLFPDSAAKRISYSQIEIYKRLFGEMPPKPHNAEDDVLTLMKCAIASNTPFVEIADAVCELFKDFKP